MNLAIYIKQYDETHAMLSDPIKNNIITDGNFIRIMYSDGNVTLNGIYLLIPMQHIQCEKYFNKYKCIFPVDLHEEIIQSIKGMEEQLLKKYSTTKIPYCKIYEQLKSGYIKLMEDIGSQPLCDFILKISGIWETQHHYGLTYKFIKTTHVVPET